MAPKSTRLLALALLPSLVHAQDADAARQADSLRFGDPAGLSYTAEFFPGAHYDASVPTPESITGRRAGDRLAHHAEIVAAFRAWAAASPRVVVEEHGRTHEGRALIHAVITSPENHANLQSILSRHARLADPRGSSATAFDGWYEELPAVAWMGYSIHGDEMSGCDAALALGYHLSACTDDSVRTLLDQLVIVVDPCLNPDGRERILGMIEQGAGHATVLDHDGMQRGRWPWGRGNHYLFDMNRDWMAGTQPETRGRWEVTQRFHPQLFVDAHEMGPLDSFLFYPQADPINPYLPPYLVEWQRRYAEGAAAAFDALGWSYYTREWADGWAPFYSDSWGSLLGGIGMLYEQASARGTPLRKSSGRIETFRETVHHQVAASWANLETLRANRIDAMRAQAEWARRNVDPSTTDNGRAFVVPAGYGEGRANDLFRLLSEQGIEMHFLPEARAVANAVRWNGERVDSLPLPRGAWLIPSAQPLAPLVKAYLSFDVRMGKDALMREREELERTGNSRIYDLTAWSLPLAFGVDGYWCDTPAGLGERTRATWEAPVLEIVGGGYASSAGFAVDGAEDASVRFAAQALEAGFVVHFSDRAFRIGEHALARGSLLVRRSENPGAPDAQLQRLSELARQAGVRRAYIAPTGLASAAPPPRGERDPEEPDFGGGHFAQLERPRVGLLANSPVEPDTFGHLWWQLDVGLGVPTTHVDAQSLGDYDLRRLNVLILPPGGLDTVLEEHKDALQAWIEAGGTLIATGEASASLTRERVGLCQTVLREDALEELDAIAAHVARETAAREVTIDEALVWGDAAPETDTDAQPASNSDADEEAEADAEGASDEEAKVDEEREQWLARFAPFGAEVRAWSDPHQWITVGSEGEIAVSVNGPSVFLTDDGVATPVRLAPAERLRLSGLVWPEARERLSESAWLTVEGIGAGQVILFADVPGYRGYHLTTARLFANAVVYGPGLGASAPVPR